MNLQKDDFLFADLKWVKGIEYLTSIVKLMLPDEVVCLRFNKLKTYNSGSGGMGM